MADMFDAEVVTLKVAEGAAYGAALQALWCWRRAEGEALEIAELTDRFVQLNRSETAQPVAASVAVYRELQALQDGLSRSLRGVFTQHRKFVLR
jgi:xylulokinase